MATLYTPTVTNSPTPFISVQSVDSTTYQSIQESQGSINYKVSSMYVQGADVFAINEPIVVQKYNSNGTLAESKMFNLADPNQRQNSRFIDLKNSNLIFDGRTRLDVVVASRSSLRIYFNCVKLEPANFLKGGDELFDNGFLKTYGFFQDYKDEIDYNVSKIQNGIKNGYDNR